MNRYEMKKIAYGSDLKNRALQVLLYLIDRSNKEGTCFPAIPTIARELHISVSTVKRALGELVEAGFVIKESRFRINKGQSSNLYAIVLLENDDEQMTELIDSDEQMNSLDIKSMANTELLYTLKCKQSEFDKIKLMSSISDRSIDIKSLLKAWTGEEFNLIPP